MSFFSLFLSHLYCSDFFCSCIPVPFFLLQLVTSQSNVYENKENITFRIIVSQNWTSVNNVRCEKAIIACVNVSFVSKTLQSPFPSLAYRLRARSNPWMGSASGLLGVLVPRILIQWQDVGSRGKHWFSGAKTEAGRFIGKADRLNWSQSNHPGTHPQAVCCYGLIIL